MRQRKARLTVRETIAQNRATIAGMCALAGKPAPEFHEDLIKPKRERKAATRSIYPTEAQVLKTILKYLRLRPEVAWVCRINSGVFSEADRFISANSQKGMSDIILMLKGGQFCALEVKSHSGRLLQHQDDFLCLILAGGGRAGVVREISDVNKILGFE